MNKIDMHDKQILSLRNVCLELVDEQEKMKKEIKTILEIIREIVDFQDDQIKKNRVANAKWL